MAVITADQDAVILSDASNLIATGVVIGGASISAAARVTINAASGSTTSIAGAVDDSFDKIGVVYDTSGSHKLTIRGSASVYSEGSDGVDTGATAQVLLKNSGSIYGGDNGVEGALAAGSVNLGTIEGQNYGIQQERGALDFSNLGLLSGGAYAISLDGSGVSTIKNSGVMSQGVIVQSAAGSLNLSNFGTLASTSFAVLSMDLGDVVINTGTIVGVVDLKGGSDFYDGRGGSILGDIRLGAGDDKAFGGDRGERFFGDAGKDRIDGGRGGDTLDGGDDDDTLDGGQGADSMLGGAGADVIYVDNVRDTVSGGAGTDTIVTDLAVYSLAARADFENLTYDGGGDARLTGNGLNNELTGGVNDDTLNGGVGADTMKGGLGDDLYRVDNAGDVVSDSGGSDQVLVTASSFALGPNSGVERIDFVGVGNFSGTGDGGANVITGGAGADRLDGGGGFDTLYGGLGDDVYVVDTTRDTVVDDGGTDTIESSVSYRLAIDNRIENLTLIGTGAISGVGNTYNNRITGNDGANVLDGGSGFDTLTGGAGVDMFAFGSGVRGNVDTITDFTIDFDKLQFDDSRFAGLTVGALSDEAFHIGTGPADASDRFIYNDVTGSLFYDRDGTGSLYYRVEIARLTAGLDLEASDIVVV